MQIIKTFLLSLLFISPYFGNAQSSLFQQGKEDYYPDMIKNFRVMKLQELNNNLLSINIPGNLFISCGLFSDVFFCSPDTTVAKELKADPHFAGTYFNLRVRHCFKMGGEYITSVEMAKDSFMEETFKENFKSSGST
jgi:hypothetical protein